MREEGGILLYIMSIRTPLTVALTLMVAVILASTVVADETINEYCPVTPDEHAEPWITTTYKGQTIGFCCKSCLRKFNANPEDYLANLPPINADNASANENVLQAAPHNEEAEHDHSADHGDTERSPTLVFLGKLHVLSVHLPIGLLPLAAILEILGISFRLQQLKLVARTNFVIGALFAVLAATLGWIAAGQSHYSGELAGVLDWHRWFGVSVASLGLVGLVGVVVARKSKVTGDFIYRCAAFTLLVLIPVTAHLGGTLIYGKHYLF